MNEGDHNSQRFLRRIRQELDKLPLTEAQKDALAPVLARNTIFLDTNGRRSAPGNLTDESQLFNFAAKTNAIVERFIASGLTTDDYLQVVLKQPQLLYQSSDTIIANIEGVALHFHDHALTVDAYLHAALNQPQLFHQSPATIIANIEEVAQHFREHGLTLRNYLQAAVKQPALFYQAPATIIANIEGVVDRFRSYGLTIDDYVEAALKAPSLFCQSPETILANVQGVAGHFGNHGLSIQEYLQAPLKVPLFGRSPATLIANIEAVPDHFREQGLTLPQYLRAALNRPSLFTFAPGTVIQNIQTVVTRFAPDGLTTREYLRAALKQPSLFYQDPTTIARHIDTVLRFADQGIFTPPVPKRGSRAGPSVNPTHAAVIDFLLKTPALMVLADDNYGLREIHQRVTDTTPDSRILRRSRYAVESELMQHLGHDDQRLPVPSNGFVAGKAAPTEEQAKRLVLRALIHAGFIRSGTLER